MASLRKLQALKKAFKITHRLHKKLAAAVLSATSTDSPVGIVLATFGDDDDDLVDNLKISFGSEADRDLE
jgi:hypothetical protein